MNTHMYFILFSPLTAKRSFVLYVATNFVLTTGAHIKTTNRKSSFLFTYPTYLLQEDNDMSEARQVDRSRTSSMQVEASILKVPSTVGSLEDGIDAKDCQPPKKKSA